MSAQKASSSKVTVDIPFWDIVTGKALIEIELEHNGTKNGTITTAGVGRLIFWNDGDRGTPGATPVFDQQFTKNSPIVFKVEKNSQQQYSLKLETSFTNTPNQRISYDVMDFQYNENELRYDSDLADPEISHIIGTDDARIGIVGMISSWNTDDDVEFSFRFDDDDWLVYEAYYNPKP